MFGDDQTTNQTSQQSNDGPSTNDPFNGFDNGFMPQSSGDDTQLATTSAPATAPFPAQQYQDDSATPVDPSQTVQPTSDDSAPQANAPLNDELLSIKQEALSSLTPLVGHLEQSPEEKFRTLMMMIQASDDHSKLKEAYDAAKQIKDDKERAQALLDVINEINYFTHSEAQQN